MGRGKGGKERVGGGRWGTRMCLRRMCNSFSFSFHAINYLGFPSVYYFYRSHLKATEEAFIYLSSVSPYPQPHTPYPIASHRIAIAQWQPKIELEAQKLSMNYCTISEKLSLCSHPHCLLGWRSCSKFVVAILTFIRDSRRLGREETQNKLKGFKIY